MYNLISQHSVKEQTSGQQTNSEVISLHAILRIHCNYNIGYLKSSLGIDNLTSFNQKNNVMVK